MLNCNHCVLDLCAVPVCNNTATITFPATAPVDGTYRLLMEFQNTAKSYELNFVAGQPVTFTINNLNENYCYEGYIVAPDGSAVPLFDNGTGYGSFRFCSIPEVLNA